jgi:HSP20 family molecular chaperone IbpA
VETVEAPAQDYLVIASFSIKLCSVSQGFSNPLCAIRFISSSERWVVNSGGGNPMSARWRRTIKTRKWLDLNEISGSKPVKKTKCAQKCKAPAVTFRPPNRYSKKQDVKPLIDIFQDNNNITIVAEIAGFNKETFKINVKDQKVTLSAKSKERRYYKSLNLPKVVIPDETRTKYKNGVLEIKLKKAESSAIGKADQHAP